MAVNIAVVDDLALDRERLLKDIGAWLDHNADQGSFACEGFSDGMSLLEGGGLAGRFSVVFMDICMADMDGLETARRLRFSQPECMIVFVTGEAHYALEAYPVHPFDFLVKPYTPKRFDQLMADLLRVMNPRREEIDVRVPYGNMTLPLDQVLSVVANGHGVIIKLMGGREVSCLNAFAEMSAALSSYPRFLNINRGILINMDLAVCIHQNNVRMSEQVLYPLRVKDRGELIRRFTQYQIRHRMGGAQ